MTEAGGSWTGTQTREQFRAVVWLRWRIFRNGFRRKGGKGDAIVLAIVLPLFLCVVLAISVGCGAAAWYFAGHGHVERIAWLLWFIFFLCQMSNINLGQPGTTFDPTQLIRFPLSLGAYAAMRLFFGVLSPSNIIVTMMSLAVALGVIAARPELWFYSLAAMAIFAATNVLFTRMVFAYVDRWLSTRRAREVFTAFIFLFSIGIQVANFAFNPAYHMSERDKTSARVKAWKRNYTRAEPYLAVLPPGLAANAVGEGAKGQPVMFAVDAAACGLYGLAFFAVFALRTRTEYKGENLSDAAVAVARPAKVSKVRPQPGASAASEVLMSGSAPGWRSTVAGIVGKEFLYLRRNIGVFYGLVAPLVMVAVFAGKMAARSQGQWVFPAALGYALLGVVPMSYNSFGLDGTGAQMYFLAPVRLRDVLLAKNLLNVIVGGIEVVAILVLVSTVAAPPSTVMLVSGILWAMATVLLAITVGNYRSITAPKKVDASKTAQKQQSPLSAFLAMGILLASGLVGWSVALLAMTFHLPWMTPVFMMLLLGGAGAVYWYNLERMDAFAMLHRDALFEELGKKA